MPPHSLLLARGSRYWRRGKQIYEARAGVKVTISLSRRSVEFFRAHAARSRVPYQRMIRNLLDGYASMYEKRPLAGKPLDKSDYRKHLEEKYR
jgi:hypothetical protein